MPKMGGTADSLRPRVGEGCFFVWFHNYTSCEQQQRSSYFFKFKLTMEVNNEIIQSRSN